MSQEAFTADQLSFISRVQGDLRNHMRAVKPRRYEHSLSVAETAQKLALLYDVDPFEARVAGILHDWDKVLPDEELLRRSQERGIDLGVDLELVLPLLHGILAARELPEIYPELSRDVLVAIERHTTAAVDMTPLDMVVFVADGIEPLRRSCPNIDRVRAMVGKSSLEDLFWNSFAGGISYVVDTRRYLYPGTIEIYNELVRRRAS